MCVAALPLADLYGFAIAFLCGHHQADLFDGVTGGFFDIYVLPGLAGFDHLHAVPVVGRADDDGIYVFVIEQGAVVGVLFRLHLMVLFQLIGTFGHHSGIHVTDGGADRIRIVLQHGVQVGPTHSVDANGTDAYLISEGSPTGSDEER